MPLDMSEVQALAGKLKGASGELGKDTTKVVRKSTKAVERGAKQRAHVLSGELRDSIHSSTTAGRSGTVTADSDHAVFNEYGTAKMGPIPFMQPSLEAEAPQFQLGVETAGTEALRKAVGG